MLAPKDPAPLFTLPRDGGETVSLEALRGKAVVLFFYPRDDTPGCTKESIGFSEHLQAFADAGALSETAVIDPDLYPDLSWSVSPYFTPGYFDPDQPFRIDAGVDLRGTYEPAPGWVISGNLRQRIAGNLDNNLNPGVVYRPLPISADANGFACQRIINIIG